jgi:hypothetical protein
VSSFWEFAGALDHLSLCIFFLSGNLSIFPYFSGYWEAILLLPSVMHGWEDTRLALAVLGI